MRMFSLTFAMSASENPTNRFTYCSTPPYLLSRRSRSANIVSGLERQDQLILVGAHMDNTYRHVNIFRAASLFEAKIGSWDNRLIIKARAGSLPTLVKE